MYALFQTRIQLSNSIKLFEIIYNLKTKFKVLIDDCLILVSLSDEHFCCIYKFKKVVRIRDKKNWLAWFACFRSFFELYK